MNRPQAAAICAICATVWGVLIAAAALEGLRLVVVAVSFVVLAGIGLGCLIVLALRERWRRAPVVRHVSREVVAVVSPYAPSQMGVAEPLPALPPAHVPTFTDAAVRFDERTLQRELHTGDARALVEHILAMHDVARQNHGQLVRDGFWRYKSSAYGETLTFLARHRIVMREGRRTTWAASSERFYKWLETIAGA